jgi:hypothetical protein
VRAFSSNARTLAIVQRAPYQNPPAIATGRWIKSHVTSKAPMNSAESVVVSHPIAPPPPLQSARDLKEIAWAQRQAKLEAGWVQKLATGTTKKKHKPTVFRYIQKRVTLKRTLVVGAAGAALWFGGPLLVAGAKAAAPYAGKAIKAGATYAGKTAGTAIKSAYQSATAKAPGEPGAAGSSPEGAAYNAEAAGGGAPGASLAGADMGAEGATPGAGPSAQSWALLGGVVLVAWLLLRD